MSIRDQIRELVRTGELFCLESEMLGDETLRTLFISEEVRQAITPPFEQSNKVLHAEFRQTLDAFLEGGEMSVGMNPYVKASDALIARVAPVEDEFFDFRIVSPHPQIRAFGGFAEKDTFVLVSWNYRDAIDKDFNGEVARCKIEWQRLFGRTEPFKGRDVNEYLSNAFAV